MENLVNYTIPCPHGDYDNFDRPNIQQLISWKFGKPANYKPIDHEYQEPLDAFEIATTPRTILWITQRYKSRDGFAENFHVICLPDGDIEKIQSEAILLDMRAKQE